MLICLSIQAVRAEILPSDDLTSSAQTLLWLNAGIGGGRPDIAYSFDVNYKPKAHLTYQFGFVHNETLTFGGTPNESISSTGASIGALKSSKHFSAAAFAGVGLVTGFRRGRHLTAGNHDIFDSGTYEKLRFAALGVTSNMQLFYKPFRYFGVGVEANACVNSQIVFESVLLSIQIGENNVCIKGDRLGTEIR
jgi:hypothetical protein